MTREQRGRFCGFALAVLTAVLPMSARAQALRVDLVNKVTQGTVPRVRLTATQAVTGLQFDLKRDDGRVVSGSRAVMAAGAIHDISLPGETGTHHFEGQVRFRARGEAQQSTLNFDTLVAAPLQVQVDRAKIDLLARRLEARLSRPPAHVSGHGFDPTGAAVVDFETIVKDTGAGDPFDVNWPAPQGGQEIARLTLQFTDTEGFFTGIALTPWSVRIAHEEVGFATDSANIAAAEEPKLVGSLKLIAEALGRYRSLGAIRLFVAGHSDSQGAAAYNVTLSQKRAQAIAAWFRKHGLRLPISYEGFGEHAPAVVTPDNTDEPRNRRVDYILAVEEPVLKATAFRATWKRVP